MVLALLVVTCKQNEPEVKIVEPVTQEVEVVKQPVKELPNKDLAKAEFEIKGMTCAMGCAKTIEKKLAKLEGVYSVNVDFKKELATIEYDGEKLSNKDFVSTVTSVSDTYKVGEIKAASQMPKAVKCKGNTDCKKVCCSLKEASKKMACKKGCDKACCNKPVKVYYFSYIKTHLNKIL